MIASIIDVIPEREGVWRLILDKTVFYPMGGGQPTDQGVFTFLDGLQGEVYQVVLKNSEINHYVKTSFCPRVGMQIKGCIDWERRYKNMRVHSAGHVVDFSMYLLGISPNSLRPIKGDHGKKPFIQYSGVVGREIKEGLQKKCNELITSDLRFSWSFQLLEEIEKEAIYLQPGLPENKPLRALRLESIGVVADGGTIVKSTQEVGNVTIQDIELTEEHSFIKYCVI